MSGTDGGSFEIHLGQARPKAVAALLRTFRDLDAAEEAFQEACLRALRVWPEKGLPRDPVAWLIFVGRNAGLDDARRQRRLEPLPLSPSVDTALEDVEAAWAEGVDRRAYRDDVLRLFFICCHPELPPGHQIALALQVVAGLSVAEIAQAFLVKPRAMEQRLTRARRKVRQGQVPFSNPTPAERAERLETVATMIYLVFNEGYSASGGEAHLRERLCREAIRLARLLLRLFPAEVEIMGLLALCLLQHSRAEARLDDEGRIILLDRQNRSLWNRPMISEGSTLLEKALRHGRPGPFQVQAAIAAVHAHAEQAETTDWQEIDRLYAILERLTPSPVITLNRAVAKAEATTAEDALELLEGIADHLQGHFHFHGVRAQLLARSGRVEEAQMDFEEALRLARTPAERQHLRQEMQLFSKKSQGSVGSSPARSSSH